MFILIFIFVNDGLLFFTFSGVAMHVSKNLLFVADSLGSIYSVEFQEKYQFSAIIQNSSSHPGLLSVDWLNQMLYIVEDEQVGVIFLFWVICYCTGPVRVHLTQGGGYIFFIENISFLSLLLYYCRYRKLFLNIITLQTSFAMIKIIIFSLVSEIQSLSPMKQSSHVVSR